MTQQVRAGYRRHRKATWGLVIALVALVAAVVIPIASGDAGKTYTIGLSPVTCSNGTASSTVTVMNTAKTATLGSMELYFPAGSVASSSPGTLRSSVTGFYQGTWDIIGNLQNLNLAKGQSTSVTVAFNSGSFSGNVQAVVKQSNNFNDSTGGANLFDNPSPWPTLPNTSCTVTLSGTVYGDTNSDGAQDNGETGLPGRTVSLVGGGTTTTDSNGGYSLTAPANANYSVCTTQSPTEAQTQPSGNTACGTTPDIAGNTGTTAASNISKLDFGITNGVVGTCGSEMTATTPAGATSYKATLQDGSTCSNKALNQKLVFNTWTDSNGQYASLRPTRTLPACDVTATNWSDLCIPVIEHLAWRLGVGEAPKPLQYDDTLPYGDKWESMPFCKVDPTTGTFTPQQILPQRPDSTYHTSCIFKTTQTVKKDASNNWYVERLDDVYSAQDGGRGMVG